MTDGQWNAFCEYKENLRKKCGQWLNLADRLSPLQKAAAEKDTPEYPLETSVVYNTAYDEIQKEDEIKLIVIGDNPGKDEQLKKNRRYLVGQSGKIADGFFRRNPELGVDFRKNVIIMNKTPVHTAKTSHLKYLLKNGGQEIAELIEQSQREMAEMAARLHQELIEQKSPGEKSAQLWLVGYAELKGRGLFLSYRDVLKNAYHGKTTWDDVFVFQHFSMNRFLVDLKDFRASNDGLSLEESLKKLGHQHRDEIFGK